MKVLKVVFAQTVFKLSIRILSDSEFKMLKKGLDFVPIQGTINERELKDLNEFCRRIRMRWKFKNEPSHDFTDTLLLELSLYGNHQKIILN